MHERQRAEGEGKNERIRSEKLESFKLTRLRELVSEKEEERKKLKMMKHEKNGNPR